MNILRYLRLKKGWSQENVASSINISKQGYSFYELGKIELSTPILHKLSELYGVSMEYIYERYVMNPPSDPKEDLRLLIHLFDLPASYREELLLSVCQEFSADKNSEEIKST